MESIEAIHGADALLRPALTLTARELGSGSAWRFLVSHSVEAYDYRTDITLHVQDLSAANAQAADIMFASRAEDGLTEYGAGTVFRHFIGEQFAARRAVVAFVDRQLLAAHFPDFHAYLEPRQR